ncbi:hypothetical protein ASZ90_016913 [hydrocarbon metagenome]|uniref:Uncharacterized protein n=1 Tax=hydrocarbon metagenome TaxID=938273 RepID=A0A0W8EAZ5_9ZZZZ
MGVGLSGAFYQVKVTGYGTTFLPVTADIDYILQGLYSGNTMISSLSWILGSFLLMAATILWLIGENAHNRQHQSVGLLLIFSGGLYLASVVIRYGPLFHGPGGIAIPFAIPLLIILGYAMVNDHLKLTPQNVIRDL